MALAGPAFVFLGLWREDSRLGAWRQERGLGRGDIAQHYLPKRAQVVIKNSRASWRFGKISLWDEVGRAREVVKFCSFEQRFSASVIARIKEVPAKRQ